MAELGNIFILGDSYSTFKGHIPEGYETWYAEKKNSSTDVFRVEDTWWHKLIKEKGGHLVYNDSFSGSTVCNTGYEGYDYTDISFLTRFERLADNGFFRDKKIDCFILFGATNDSWADSPIGKLKYTEVTKEDCYSFLPAFCRLLCRIKTELQGTRVVFVLNYGLKDEIIRGSMEACKHYGAEFLPLDRIDLCENHPTRLGMEQIKCAIARHLGQIEQ